MERVMAEWWFGGVWWRIADRQWCHQLSDVTEFLWVVFTYFFRHCERLGFFHLGTCKPEVEMSSSGPVTSRNHARIDFSYGVYWQYSTAIADSTLSDFELHVTAMLSVLPHVNSIMVIIAPKISMKYLFWGFDGEMKPTGSLISVEIPKRHFAT
jgi:hypothetical protein